MNTHSHEDHVCNCTSACSQSLDEMEFERGIWSAARDGEMERVKKLAQLGVDKMDSAGYTALHYAARAGHVDVCKILISLGACLDIQTRSGLATPLHRAVTAGKISTAKILINAKAAIDIKDSDGRTILHRAANEGHLDLMQYILSINRKLLLEKDNHGNLPIDLALKSKSAQNEDFLNLFKL